MLGGGNYKFYNKILPGSYINFVSLTRASVDMADRGYVALALPLGWGKENELMVIDKASFEKNSLELLGYPYDHDMMLPFREIFLNAKEILFMNLSKGEQTAKNDYATANYPGARGHSLAIRILSNTEDGAKFDVQTLFDGEVVDTILKVSKEELQGMKNAYVTFNSNITKELTTTNSDYLSGTIGTAGSQDKIGITDHQKFLNALENEYFNILICTSEDETIKKLYVQYTKRLRNEVGAKFQTIVYNNKANFEGVVNLGTTASCPLANLLNGKDENNIGKNGALIFWVGGALGGCAINESITNKLYDGEITEIELNETQPQLETSIKEGVLVLHRVGKQIRVLTDINSFVEYTPEKNKDFSKNQVIRLLDQVAVDIANLFNKKYLGKFPNDEAGRMELWKDIVLHHETLQNIRAIENFKDTDIQVVKGQEKDELIITDLISPVVVMEKLYMQVVVK